MKNSKRITIAGIVAIVAFIAMGTSVQTTSFAESVEDSVNNVVIRTVFQFNDGKEEINTFKVYKQISGYGEDTTPKFVLEGIVDGSHPLLYAEAHKHHHQKGNPAIARDFDVAVYLTDQSITDIHFLYSSCDILNYYIKTGEDPNVRVWNGQAKFPHVEHFVIECNGFHPFHQIDDPTNSFKKTTQSNEIIEEETPTWKDFFN